MPRFSLRLAAAGIAAIAIALALLRYPVSSSMMIASALLVASILLAVCLAIGSTQPARTLWVGYLAAAVGSLWFNYGETPKNWGIPQLSTELAGWLDGHLRWSAPRGKPGSVERYVTDSRLYEFRFDSEGLLQTSIVERLRDVSPVLVAKLPPLEARPEVPTAGLFRSIFAKLFAIFCGCIGAGVAWAARTRSMRSAADAG